MELTVRGVDPPAEELSGGLLNHLREKLEELTLALFAQLLPRIAHTRLSEADLSFLRPPDAPPLAVATVPLPAAIGGRGVADADAEGVWRAWLSGCAGWLRAGGWCPLNHAPSAHDREVLTLLHLPRAHGRSGQMAQKLLLCVYISLERMEGGGGGIGDAKQPGVVRVDGAGGGALSVGRWCMRLSAWGRSSDGIGGGGGGMGASSYEGRRRGSMASGSDPPTPTVGRNAPSASLPSIHVESLCAALASRLSEADVVASFHAATSPPTEAALSPTWRSVWAHAATVHAVSASLCAACAVGSSAASRLVRPLRVPGVGGRERRAPTLRDGRLEWPCQRGAAAAPADAGGRRGR